MSDCIFCAIPDGTAPAEVVGSSDRALAFMDLNPATDGHVLVIPRAHATDIWELSSEDGVAVWLLAADVAMRIREGLRPQGLTLFQANGRAGWQDVFHFHLHLVPRWDSDGLVRPWTSSDERRLGMAEVAERIRQAAASSP